MRAARQNRFAIFAHSGCGALPLPMRGEGFGSLIITHYQRLLNYITPDVIHIMMERRVIMTGNAELAKRLEAEGYKGISEKLGLHYDKEA